MGRAREGPGLPEPSADKSILARRGDAEVGEKMDLPCSDLRVTAKTYLLRGLKMDPCPGA